MTGLLPPDGTSAGPGDDGPDGRIYRLLRLLLVAGSVLLAVWLVKDVLVVLFASVLLAVILHGLSRLLRRLIRLPFGLCLLLVVIVLMAAVAGFVVLVGPGLADQASGLRQALSGQVGALQERLAATRWGRTLLDQVPGALGGSRVGGGNGIGVPSGLAGSVFGFLGSALGLLGTIAVVVIAGIYLAASPQTYANGALRMVAPAHRPRVRALLLAGGEALWSWSAGQALDMLVVGVLSGAGLTLLGVPLALALGVIAALFNFVPYIGALIGAVPAILVAFSQGAATGIETAVLYAVIQAFEGNVMAPLIQNRAAHLPPGLTVLSQTAFGSVLGVPGLIFATPLTAAILAMGDAAVPKLDAAERL